MFAQNAIGFWSETGVSYDADLVTYMTGLATPLSDGQKTLLNTFILALKSGLSITNLSDAFDVMYVLGNETAEAALRNLVKRANDATAVNTPTFTALEGYATDAISQYLDYNYNPTSHAVNYLQNSASVGGYNRVDATSALIQVGSTSGPSTQVISDAGDGKAYMRLNHVIGGAAPNATNADAKGCYIASRNASNEQKLWRNKVAIITSVIASTGIPNKEFNSGKFDITGLGVSYFSVGQLSLFFAGRKFNETEVGVITDAFEAYMDANSKGVI